MIFYFNRYRNSSKYIIVLNSYFLNKISKINNKGQPKHVKRRMPTKKSKIKTRINVATSFKKIFIRKKINLK